MTEKSSNEIDVRREKVTALRDQQINPYPNQIRVTHTIREINALVDTHDGDLPDSDARFALAGRIMAINRFGKSAFVRFRDRTGQLQAYIRKDQVDEDAFTLFGHLDVGDFIGLEGKMFQTRTGEWTLLAEQLKLVCKATRPLPEKFHGIRDPEKRYRRRYLDLIMNPPARDIFIKRDRIVQTIRKFLLAREYLEVETPMMQPIAGGAEATPFVTRHQALGMDLFLRIAPELYLKRLVVGGFERVFEINRNFRNEGISTRHNPEFTMIELYQAFGDWTDVMAISEILITQAARDALGTTTITIRETEVDLAEPWPRHDMSEMVSTAVGTTVHPSMDLAEARRLADTHGASYEPSWGAGRIIEALFEELCEPTIVRPTFITGHPVEISPLARVSRDDPHITERFEILCDGRELGNGYSELNDPVEQRLRFEDEQAAKEAGDDERGTVDEDYLRALEYGMPPTGGLGIGIDRVAMLLAGVDSIREVVLFPTLRPEVTS